MNVARAHGSRGIGATRPPGWLGVAAAAVSVAAATALIYALERIAPVVSLSVVYLPGVLVVSAYWGLALGVVTSLLSAAAFNFFHIPPVDRFTIADSRNWVALAAFILVSVVVSTVADIARSRTLEAERGRAQADLAAALARELLAGARTQAALASAGPRVAAALSIPSATIELGAVPAGAGRRAIGLYAAEGGPTATLVVPADLPPDVTERLRIQVAPVLEALVAIALHRDAVQDEAVETAALRRSDELKTALLAAVSHDLRTPVTAIVAAGHALGVRSLTDDERGELSRAVVEEGERLSTLIDKLLDLSRLQAGRAQPRTDWVSLEEVLTVSRDRLAPEGAPVHIQLDAGLPWLRADAAQLERVFVNLLENARRFSSDRPVSVHAHRVGSWVAIRVVDHGPGINPGDRARLFEPFYRGSQHGAVAWKGSGLGLAIARGFVEANGGRISVESLPGQGTTFVVELPVPREAGVLG